MKLATPEAFAKTPDLVHEFYNYRRRMLLDPKIQPNAAHQTLAELESRWKGRGSFTLVTQNVDNLHERAGSRNVVHIHGELTRARCMDSGKVFEWTEDLSTSTVHPEPDGRAGRLRPHIVWFGEIPMRLEPVQNAISECDLFVTIGSSGVVWPAAGLVQWAPAHCRRVLMNLEPSANAQFFDETIAGAAAETVPEFFRQLVGPGHLSRCPDCQTGVTFPSTVCVGCRKFLGKVAQQTVALRRVISFSAGGSIRKPGNSCGTCGHGRGESGRSCRRRLRSGLAW